MIDETQVLIASFSSHDRHELEVKLKTTRWSVWAVADAEDAAHACVSHDGASILVIDAGLLETTHDPQWRGFRARHRKVGAVVRCLIPRGEIRRVNRVTFQVRPDDDEGILQALCLLEESLRTAR